MIRTRDFFLYVIVFVFLVLGITYTVARDLSGDASQTVETVDLQQGSTLQADPRNTDTDRAGYIAKLKDKIMAGKGEVIGSPVTLTSVDETEEEPEEEIQRIEQRCTPYTPFSLLVSTWDEKAIDIRFVEGAHVVFTSVNEQMTNGSSTEVVVREEKLLQSPMQMIRNLNDTCLRDPVVGISLDNTLILNTDVSKFLHVNDEVLIGYALDGFPIFGVKADSASLDTCGGTAEGGLYSYYLREGEDFVIGCFAGTPVALSS